MNAALGPYRAAWAAAFTGGRRGRRVMPIAAGIAALLFVAGGVARGAPLLTVMQYAAAAAIATFVFGALMYFVPGAVLQNTPANARLVPGMRRRLVVMTSAVWLLGSLLVAWLAGLLPVAPLVGMYVIGLSLARAGHQKAGMALFMPATIFGPIQRSMPPELLWILANPAGTLVEMLLLALVGAYALALIYPNGGDRHFDGRGAQEAAARLQRHLRQDVRATWLGGSFSWGLRRDCRRGHPLPLMLHVLGPSLHWSAALVAGLFVVATGLVVKAGLALWASDDTITGLAATSWGMLAPLMMMHVAVVELCDRRIATARTEEALFRLTPSSPRPAAFNRLFGAALASRVLSNWLVLAAALAAVTAMMGGSLAALVSLGALCSLAGLPLVGVLLEDYAREQGVFYPGVAVWFTLLSALSALVAFVAWRWCGLPFWPSLLVAANVIGTVFVASRWQRMVKAPVAFPSRRM